MDRYVLRQIAKPLLAAMGIGLSMLLAERLVRLLESTLGKKNSFGMVFELLAYLVPHYLGIAIPAALFLGLLFGFNRLSKNNEIDASLAVGVGLSRLTRPVILLSCLLAALSFFIIGWLQPITRYAYRSLMFDVGNVEVFYLAQEGVFMQSGSRTFILDRLNRSNSSFKNVFLFDDKGPSGLETLTASSGQLLTLPGERRPILRLKDGNRLRIDRWPTYLSVDPPSNLTSFDLTDAPLGHLTNKVFRPRGDDERELTLPELYLQTDHPPAGATVNSMQAEFNKRIVNVFTLFMLPFMAVPFAIGRQRNQRGYRFGAALVIVVAFHEIIEQGAVATRVNGISPLLTLWLPLVLFSAFSLWIFYRTAFTLRKDRLGPLIDALRGWIAKLLSPLTRRYRSESRT